MPIRYIITKQPHSRTQQFILWTTSLIACTLTNSKQTISIFHFRSLCFPCLRLWPYRIHVQNRSLFITPIRLQFPSFLHSLYSSLFYAMNVHYSHTNEIICPSHSTIEWGRLPNPLYTLLHTSETRITTHVVLQPLHTVHVHSKSCVQQVQQVQQA